MFRSRISIVASHFVFSGISKETIIMHCHIMLSGLLRIPASVSSGLIKVCCHLVKIRYIAMRMNAGR